MFHIALKAVTTSIVCMVLLMTACANQNEITNLCFYYTG